MSGMFDNIRNKAEEAAANNPDKVEQLSDQGLDRAQSAADSATGGKHTDQITSAREQIDQRIGNEGAAEQADGR